MELSSLNLGALRIPIPSPDEQGQIANFLDRETAKIDELIAKKRELIERLREKRTALISHVVTKGLPPDEAAKHGLPVNPPRKPSGVPWLGDIPLHWVSVAVRRLAFRVQTGSTPRTSEERFYEDGDLAWFGPSSFRDQLDLSQPVKHLNRTAITEGAARLFAPGSTMIVTIGATLGKVGSIAEFASCNQQITVIEFDPSKVHGRFASYALKRLESALRAIAPSATLPILDQGEIADISIGLPPLEEQNLLSAYIDRETCRLDRTCELATQLIERLQEYRSALITAAVTGKIDVREEPTS